MENNEIKSVFNTNNQLMGSLTPYILEERQMRAVQMDIFSRMLIDRILWISGPITDELATVFIAQLLWLDTINNQDITVYIDSPGGSVKAGRSMVDVMNYISSDVIMVNTGMAASMGSVLLTCGTKGKRYSLPSAKVMLHQVSYGASGNIQDIEIVREEAIKENEALFRIIGERCGKDWQAVKNDATRDKWLSAEEAVAYGLIDGIIKSKKELKAS